ncbi:MAG: hypothetical protein JSS20_22180 [Proteobacteria bacterium]|nr:hypothetical protein [Pseudomonadota bacterium]
MKAFVGGCAVLAAIFVGARGSGAEPLAPEQCERLKAEQQALVEAKIPDIVRQGPAWAKANAGPDKVKAAQRYIELQEQLLFRCGLAKLKPLPAGAGDEYGDGGSVPASQRSEPPAETAPKAAPKKTAPKAAAKREASSDEPPAPAKAAPKPQAKPKAKPKADDAYRPPAKADGEPTTSQ